jgi:hypothetical protein
LLLRLKRLRGAFCSIERLDPLSASTDQEASATKGAADGKTRSISAAARRALEEAAARRADEAPRPPREIGGRDGPEPTRYGDWEVKGLASDF